MSHFDPSGLERLRHVLSGYVERKELPGLVALISCGSEVHLAAMGRVAFGADTPMSEDSVFRIASLTKVIVAAAGMMLVEDCVLRLEDAIDPWLPELADRRVLRAPGADLCDTVPVKRSITVRDLFTYRMGLGSIMAPPDTYPIQTAIRDQKIGGDGPPMPSQMLATGDWLKNLSSLPLLTQPGEQWMYHTSGDVLGVLIARASGMSLGAFLEERIFAPLGMHDTGFWVRPNQGERLTTVYRSGAEPGTLAEYDGVKESGWAAPPAFESGGGGLVSTVKDYHAFSRMLLAGGAAGGRRILSPASITLMCSDQISAQQRANAKLFFRDHSSWGLGFAVDIARSEIYHSPGRFGWTGGLGTTAYADPANDIVGILFTQRMMDSPVPPRFFDDFWNCAYAAWRGGDDSEARSLPDGRSADT